MTDTGNQLLYYPKGRIALGNGDLMDVFEFELSAKNGAKLKHTLRRSPSGVVLGVKEATVDFQAICSEKGFERDYMSAVLNGTIKQLRLKFPGETVTFTGVPTERSTTAPLEDAISYKVNWIGKVSITNN